MHCFYFYRPARGHCLTRLPIIIRLFRLFFAFNICIYLFQISLPFLHLNISALERNPERKLHWGSGRPPFCGKTPKPRRRRSRRWRSVRFSMIGYPSFFRPRATQNAIIGAGKIALGGFGERVSAREMERKSSGAWREDCRVERDSGTA